MLLLVMRKIVCSYYLFCKKKSHGHHDKHDNDADADCIVSLNFLSLDNFHHKASCVRQINSKSAIHIRINLNNNPFGDSSHHNILGAPHLTRGFEHPRSINSEYSSDSDEEPLDLADILVVIQSPVRSRSLALNG
jgi:hypothetical protein